MAHLYYNQKRNHNYKQNNPNVRLIGPVPTLDTDYNFAYNIKEAGYK